MRGLFCTEEFLVFSLYKTNAPSKCPSGVLRLLVVSKAIFYTDHLLLLLSIYTGGTLATILEFVLHTTSLAGIL